MVHGSLFSGIGGFDLAAEWMGWENAFHCEIGEFGRRVLNYYWPNAISYENIKETDFTIWRGRIDILTGGFPCFASGTRVLSEHGLVNIENLKVGDKVFTKEGELMPVNAKMITENVDTLLIRSQGMYKPMETTKEHPFWVKRKISPSARKHENRFSDPMWVKAGEIKKGDLVSFRCNEGTVSFGNKDFWYIVGRYLGDGWIRNGKRVSKVPKGQRGSRINSTEWKVIICCNKENKDELHERIKAAGFNSCVSECRTTYKFIICSKSLVKFLNRFGKYAHGKKLTGLCFSLKNELKKSLFEGWLDADGYIDNGKKIVTTVSEELAIGMAQIARDVYKMIVNISKKTCNRRCIIEGRVVSERPQYCITVSNSMRFAMYEDGFLWCLVKSVQETNNKKTVYNIGVYESETYTADGVVCHNCQPYSTAGKRLGKEDERHLWPEMLRAIREAAPRYVVGENVSGILSWNEGLVFDEVQADLENEGYEVQPVVLPACGVNAPHKRDRVWFVAKNALQNGWGSDIGQKKSRIWQQRNTVARTDEWVQTNNGQIKSIANSNRKLPQDRTQNCKQQNKEEDRSGMDNRTERLGNFRNAPDTYCKRLERGTSQRNTESRGREDCSKKQPIGRDFRKPRNIWQDFPTQSPICIRNDGISDRLDGITFPAWRRESIKAYGNAIVPQVAYQIFKAIEETERKMQ